MNVYGEWGPIVSLLGSVAALIFFGHKAVRLVRARQHRRRLARGRAGAPDKQAPPTGRP